jgi:uridine kinase
VSSQSRGMPGSGVSNRPIVVGVAGGTGSGNTTVVAGRLKGLDTNDVLVTQHDSDSARARTLDMHQVGSR